MFGLNKNDLKMIQNKLDNQSSYLDNNYFTTSSGQIKTLKDVSYSANHSVRYYAQLNNKIDTMTKTALSQGLHSCFLTMTLDGYFRDLLHGDYARFDNLSNEDKFIALQGVPSSESLGEVRQKIESRMQLDIKDLYNILNHQTKRYLKSYAFKKLKKANQNYMYIRTVEPHKDGIPHFHMMLYIPFEHIEQFKKDFIKSYPAPQNRRIRDSKKYIQDFKIDNQELESFQTKIEDTTAYVMKYILKSFMDVKNQKEIDYIQAWYIKHRIMRCVTSRSLVPQWVYQLAYAFESDWYHLTDLMNDKNNHVEWSKEDNYFYFIDNHTKRELIYQYGKFQVVYEDRVIKEIGQVREKKFSVEVYDKTPTKWTKKEIPVPTYLDNNLIGYFTKQNGFKSSTIQPYQMNHFDLYTYFHNMDVETVNLSRYMVTRNLMIDRGLLQADKLPIDIHKTLEVF
ncbi:MAG: replication endonuclease [Sulfurimonas sp.]|nr:replication endonuclease [Sulfurimonas sp.]